MRVGCEKGERTFRISLVFSQVKGDSTQQVSIRIQFQQQSAASTFGIVGALQKFNEQLSPQPFEQVIRQKFQPAHRRRFRDQNGEDQFIRCRDDRPTALRHRDRLTGLHRLLQRGEAFIVEL